MCLYVKIPKRLRKKSVGEIASTLLKVAKKDKVVHKILYKPIGKSQLYHSIVKSFPYKIGHHYYQTGKKFTYKVSMDSSTLLIFRGLHSFVFKRKLHLSTYAQDKAVVKCIIPKGSTYFINNKTIVSDNLIIDSICS